MTLAQRIVIASDESKGVMALTLAALMLFGVIAVLVFVGVHPAPVQAQASPEQVTTSPVANSEKPACAAALARARDTRGMSARDAIAASTAMLRACDIRSTRSV